jgi:predicted N-acetyltransferase YhbS
VSELRQLRPDDAEAVAALFRAAFGEERPMDAEEIRGWTRNTELQPGWLRVLEEDGQVVGYGDIWPTADDLAVDVAAPGHWEAFLDWAELHARDAAIPRVRVFLPAGADPASLLLQRGYRLWRSSYTMEIDLPERPAEPPLPTGVSVRSYGPADDEPLLASLNEAFAEDPFWHATSPADFREFYLRARGFDPGLWLLAWDGDELAGSALAYSQRGPETELGWVGTLSVRAPWRKQGLGTALLRRAFGVLYDRGLRRAGLGVDGENVTGALQIYERAGMRRVRQGDNWVLEL